MDIRRHKTARLKLPKSVSGKETVEDVMRMAARVADLIAYLWPFAIFNGDLWNVTIRGKFK